MVQLQPTPSVLAIASRLEEAGYEAWCVGGAIRDAMLGGAPLDWDIATSARPEAVQELFGRKRTIPVGIEFGTVCVLDPAGVGHEITTFRRDVKTDGRHAVVEFGASLDDDLARRDFTINAIAFRPRTGELRDPFGGRNDLALRVVRAVGDPDARMREDRLRALRGIRFAARYEFTLEPETLRAVRSSAPHLTRLSAERVQQEIMKVIAQVARPSRAFMLWRDLGAFGALVPSLAGIGDIALDTLDRLPREDSGGRSGGGRSANRLAALFLDVPTATVGAALTALRFAKHEIRWTTALASAWQAVSGDIARVLSEGAPSDEQVRRWLAAIGRTYAGGFMRIALARWSAERAAGRAAPDAAAIRALHARITKTRLSAALELADLAVDGDTLRAAGIPPGPLYAKILNSLLDRVLATPSLNTEPALMAEVPKIVAAIG